MIGIVLAALLWGTTGTAATLLPASVGPLATGAATMCLGGLLLAATAPRRTVAVLRGRTTGTGTGTGTWRWLVPGALGVAVYPLAFYSSMALAGVAIGNVVSLGTAPVFAAVLERFVVPVDERRPLDRRWALGAGTAVAGVALLAAFGHHQEERTIITTAEQPDLPASATDPTGALLAGVALGVLAGLAYATYTVTAGRLIAGGASSRGAMAAQFGVGAALLLPVLLVTGRAILGAAGDASGPYGTVPAPSQTPLLSLLGAPHPALVVAYLALGPMFLAYLAFGRGLRTVPGSRATTVTLLEPVVATLLAVVAVGERLAPLGWAGVALVLVGVVGVALDRRPPPALARPPVPRAAGQA